MYMYNCTCSITVSVKKCLITNTCTSLSSLHISEERNIYLEPTEITLT